MGSFNTGFLALLLLTIAQVSFQQVNLSGSLCVDPTSKFWIVGEESSMKDDSPSKASCPDGYYAAECLCEDTLTCDGAAFQDDTQTCITYHYPHYKQSGTKAMVRCQLGQGMDVKIVRNLVPSNTPVSCPEGYIMESCAIHDPWKQEGKVDMKKALNEREQLACSWTHPTRNVAKRSNTLYMSASCVRNIAFD